MRNDFRENETQDRDATPKQLPPKESQPEPAPPQPKPEGERKSEQALPAPSVIEFNINDLPEMRLRMRPSEQSTVSKLERVQSSAELLKQLSGKDQSPEATSKKTSEDIAINEKTELGRLPSGDFYFRSVNNGVTNEHLRLRGGSKVDVTTGSERIVKIEGSCGAEMHFNETTGKITFADAKRSWVGDNEFGMVDRDGMKYTYKHDSVNQVLHIGATKLKVNIGASGITGISRLQSSIESPRKN